MKHINLRELRQNTFGIKREVLQKPLPDLLSVMCVCNRAHFERNRSSQYDRVSTQRKMRRASRELRVSGHQTKRFTVM